MYLEQFYKELSQITALRETRLKYANKVLENMGLFPILIDILFMVDDKVSCRAAWVFELVCDKNIYTLVPHLDRFTGLLKKIHLDSAVRPVAKVCQFIAKENFSKNSNTLQNVLTPIHKELITEACFDWLISDQKVAPKVYSMECLFHLGKEIKWIHPELSLIIEQDSTSQSAAYKARAKHILKRIKNLQESKL